jgi:hypothetical protein
VPSVVISVNSGQDTGPSYDTPNTGPYNCGYYTRADSTLIGTALTALTLNGATVVGLFEATTVFGNPGVLVVAVSGAHPETLFSSFTSAGAGANPSTYLASAASYAAAGSTVTVEGYTIGGAGVTCWVWGSNAFHNTFNTSYETDLTFNYGSAMATDIGGQGDITDPGAWVDSSGNIPPLVYQEVPQTVNYPLNGDGRYWFVSSASSSSSAQQLNPVEFIGNSDFLVDTCALQSTITQAAKDGSELFITYSLNGGATWISAQLGPSLQNEGLVSAATIATLTSASGLQFGVYTQGGTPGSGQPWNVAIALTRNVNEQIAWDYPNPFNPISYNCECMDDVVPTETMAALQLRILNRTGFANQAANPNAGVAAFVQDNLISAQRYLYRRYSQLHTRRMFRWKVNPGQRFYSLKDNDEDVLCNFQMDPNKQIEWAGIQDSRNVWYPLIEGIPPQLYTMIDKPWRPARYEIRQCIEVYPAPDQTYWMWFKAHFGLMSFAAPTDSTTIDAELVFLWALANVKSHYGQPDANNIASQANAYRKELIAGTHQTAHYVPGTIAVPPAVRPTLIQFQNNQSG